MSVRIEVQTTGTAVEDVAMLASRLGDTATLHARIASRAETLTFRHLSRLANSRHASAQAVGGTPTGHLAAAAASVAGTSDAAAATVSITSPGIRRALGDITIRPGGGKSWLTIPISGEAYGQRVGELERRLGRRLFRPGPKLARRRVLAAGDGRGGLTYHYALVASVTQRQDRTLLPADDDYLTAATKAALDYLELDVKGDAAK